MSVIFIVFSSPKKIVLQQENTTLLNTEKSLDTLQVKLIKVKSSKIFLINFLVKPHKAGAVVELVQTSVDKK